MSDPVLYNDPRVNEIRLKAADLLEKHGWVQGTWGRDGGPRCMLGACRVAAGVNEANCGGDAEIRYGLAEIAALFSVEKATNGTVHSPVLWNDDPDRTAEEVIAALRAVDE